MTTVQHNDWADSMADWGHCNAAALKEHAALEQERRESMQAERAEPEIEWVEMQGRPAWPARRCSPEMAVYDSTEDDERREDMSGHDAVALTLAIIASCAFVAWLLRMAFGVVSGWM